MEITDATNLYFYLKIIFRNDSLMMSIHSSNLPVSSFYVKTEPSVDGVGMPLGALFHKEHLSIALQRSIADTLRTCRVGMYTPTQPPWRMGTPKFKMLNTFPLPHSL